MMVVAAPRALVFVIASVVVGAEVVGVVFVRAVFVSLCLVLVALLCLLLSLRSSPLSLSRLLWQFERWLLSFFGGIDCVTW